MEDLFRALPKILSAAGNSTEVLEAASIAAWKHVVGDGLRWNAVPSKLIKTALVVAVPDAAWKKQLEPMSGQFLLRVNALLGQKVVTYLDFRVDPSTVEAERKTIRDSGPPSIASEAVAIESTKGIIAVAANGIRDQALRDHFLRAAGSCLCRTEVDHGSRAEYSDYGPDRRTIKDIS